ncbi:MAG: MMPL family transporter [Nocardioides sp.]|uniref:MMPL family transporter n=1 Tax=Nocardioides sp. TaxID=35761 RepID=UPI0039E57F46
MSALARWCSRHRFIVLGGWVGAVVLLIGLVVGVGSDFKTTADLPDSESAQAYTLIGSAQASSGDTETGRIAWHTTGEAVDAGAVRTDVAAMLAEVADLPGVVSVQSPYGATESAQLSLDQDTAYAVVTVTDDVDVDEVTSVAESIESDAVQVELGGHAFAPVTESGGIAEGVGILAALVILLLMFRSAWAALLPIITGVAGVVTSLLLVMVGSHVVDLASESITMGSLIGLGVGIDYALFIVNRHRKALMAGDSVEESIRKAEDTSGRAVIFAGMTVIAALVAMRVVDMSVLTGMGQAAAVTVVFTVLAAITLLPALLAMLGTRVLSKRQRRQLAEGAVVEATAPARRTPGVLWSRLVTRAPKPMSLVALVVLAALAIPFFSMRVGEADASTDKAGSASRDYYEMVSPAFGEGLDATLVLAAKTPDAASAQAFADLATGLASVDDVASASAPVEIGDGVSVIQLTPSSSSGSEATVDLVHHLRDDVIPAAESGSGLQVYVGGETATNIDIADHLMSNLPLYLLVIAVLGFLLLMVAFRSLLLPLVGALSNLTTILVGLGVVTAIFQWGWGSTLLGVGDGAAISYIVPVMIVGLMFGLSMDYQVFLVSRMHEEWTHGRDHVAAIRAGVAETSKVIITAALIMLAVFASFGFSGQRIVSAIGVGLALAVVVDALVVRMILIPALMRLIGPRIWAYPRWADRITPHLSVEGPSTADAQGSTA